MPTEEVSPAVDNIVTVDTKFRIDISDFLDTAAVGASTCGERGIAVCIETIDELVGAWTGISLLRELGCTLPVYIWHRGVAELVQANKTFEPLNVCLVDAETYSYHEWLSSPADKPLILLALAFSPFGETLALKGDILCTADPEPLFDDASYRQSGARLWSSGRLSADDTAAAIHHAVRNVSCHENVALLDRSRAGDAALLALWLLERSLSANARAQGENALPLVLRLLERPVCLSPADVGVAGYPVFYRGADREPCFQQVRWDETKETFAQPILYGARLAALAQRLVNERARESGADTYRERVAFVRSTREGMHAVPFEMRAMTHGQGHFRSLSGANVLIYWPHGFGDWVFFSYLLPLLSPANRYFVARFGDDSTAVFEDCERITPLYLGTNSPHCGDGDSYGIRHFGVEYHDMNGHAQTLQLPFSLYQQCRRWKIDTFLWSSFPEVYGSRGTPFHSKARNLISYMVPAESLRTTDITRPLRSAIEFRVSAWLQRWVEDRLASFAGFGTRKLCLITRNGYTATGKNWGHMWREEMPEGRRREGQECRDFMRLMLKKDPNWLFLVMEDRLFSGDDTVRDDELNCYSFAQLFGEVGGGSVPFGLLQKALMNLASLSIGVPAGPYHLSMAKTDLPTVGLWLEHLPSWYDEPKEASVHVVSRNTHERGFWSRPGSFEEKGSLRFRTLHTDTRIITGLDVLNAVETLL